jgi:hypothetical protein
MKAILLKNMVGGDLLQFFENYYFSRLPMSRLQRRLALWRHVWIHWVHNTSRPLRLLLERRRKRMASGPAELVTRGLVS